MKEFVPLWKHHVSITNWHPRVQEQHNKPTGTMLKTLTL